MMARHVSDSQDDMRTRVRYYAIQDGREILGASSLKELSKKVTQVGIDPRDIEIQSTLPSRPAEKLGLRISHRAEQ